jgi:Phosphopantetheine attachment site
MTQSSGAPGLQTCGRVQEVIRAAWKAHLRRDDFRDDESFFRLGGDSLLAAKVMARVSRELGSRLRVGLLLRNPTVSGLSTAAWEALGGTGLPR